MLYLLVLLLLMFGGPAVSQKKSPSKSASKSSASKATTPAPPAAPANQWPIQSMKVEGNKAYSTPQIVAATGLKIGQLAGKEEFEAARDRLVASGVFESVGYRF